MTYREFFKLGRINANEDEARLVQIGFKDGQEFHKGELLLALETTKAAIEIAAPSDGRMITFFASDGMMLRVGDRVFEAEFRDKPAFEILDLERSQDGQANSLQRDIAGERKVSFKAAKLANSLGLDVANIPAQGDVLKEADVIAYSKSRGAASESKSRPQQTSVFQTSRCIVFGAGGHARSLIQMIRQAGYTISGVLDTKLPKDAMFLDAYPVLGTTDDLKQIYDSGIRTAFIGVGGATSNENRKKIFAMLKMVNFSLPPLVSHDASFDLSSFVGDATYVWPAASVSANCMIGDNCIINQGSIMCHDCKVADHAHLAPGAILAGTCTIGEGTTIGMSATVMNNVTVGRDCLVHNNVAITQDVPAGKIITLKGILDRVQPS